MEITLFDCFKALIEALCGGCDPAVIDLCACAASIGTVVALIIVPILCVFKSVWTRK